MRRIWISFYALFLLTSVEARAQQPYVITNDSGGRIGTYVDKYRRMAAAHIPIEVRGWCASACTLALGLVPKKQVCISRNASLGFHAPWDYDRRGKVVWYPDTAIVMFRKYDPFVRKLIKARGGLTSKDVTIPGSEFLGAYRECHQG